MYGFQKSLLVDQPITIKANSDDEKVWDWGSVVGIVGSAGMVIFGAALCATGVGAIAGAGLIGAGSSAVIAVGTGTAVYFGGRYIGVKAREDFAEKLSGDYDLPFIYYTPANIFSNQIPIFDINFFSNKDNSVKKIDIDTAQTDEQYEVVSESSAYILRPYISSAYVTLRTVAIVAMLSILAYVGIRMIISSASKDRAKYKQMLVDWLVGMCLLCVMHYIMIFIVTISENISELLNQKCIDNIVVDLPADTTINGEKLVAGENGYPQWICSFTGYTRLKAKGFRGTEPMQAVLFTVMYVVLVIYTIIFTVIYLKRVIYMAFLTIIAPLVAMTYPIDKLNDGQAQGFNTWLKEYIFNALLQPVHLLIYTILIGSVMNLVEKYPMYALVALGFMIPAEKMLKSMFGFQKAQSPAAMGAVGMAGTGMLMSGIGKLLHGNRGRGNNEESGNEKNKIRMKRDRSNAIDSYANENSNNSGSNIISNGTNNRENNDTQQAMLDSYDENYGASNEWNPQERDEMAREANNGETMNYSNEEYENILRQSGYSHEEIDSMMNENDSGLGQDSSITTAEDVDNTRNQNINPRTTIKSRIGRGLSSMGGRYYGKIHPLRSIRRGATFAAGAATLGMVGLAAGIASGDLGKTAQYAGTAANIGGNMGRAMGNKISSGNHKNLEAFKQGWYGSEYEDKLREKQIRQLQSNPENIQYLRNRDSNYRQILRDAYPEYARNGCYDIEDFWAAYQLEKSGRSRASAISAYRLASRTGDISSSPDAENKWRNKLETEFGNVDNVRNITDVEYRRIGEQFKAEQERINAEYEAQRRMIENSMENSEDKYKEIERQLEAELRKSEADYDAQYKLIEASTIDDEFEYRKVETQYKESSGIEKSKYEEKYKELYKKMQEEVIDKKRKQEQLKKRYEENNKKIKQKYEDKLESINAIQKEQFKKLEDKRNQKIEELNKRREAQESKVKEISEHLSEQAIDDIKMFYANKE